MTAMAQAPQTIPAVTNSTRRTIVNLLHVVGGEFALRVATFAAAVVIGRLGGAAIFGIYATTLAYATIAAMIADNGLQVGGVREISANPQLVDRTVTKLLVAKTLLFVPMAGILLAVGWLMRLSRIDWAIAILITLRTILQSYCQMQISVIKAIDRMKAIGVTQAVHASFLMIALGWCYAARSSVLVIVALLFIGQVLEMAIEAGWLRFCGVHLVRVSFSECWHMLRGSTSMGAIVSLSAATMRLDVIVLSLIAGAAAVGIFAAAQTVVVILYVLGWLTASVLFPDMNRLASRTGDLDAYVRYWVKLTALVMVPGTLIGILVAPFLVPLLFGSKFHGSGTLLAVMLPAAPFIIINAIYLYRSFALHERSTYIGIYCGAFAWAVIVGTLAAVAFGAMGVAVAVTLREIAVFVAFRILNRPRQAEFSSPAADSGWFEETRITAQNSR